MPHHWRPLAHERNSIFKCKQTVNGPWWSTGRHFTAATQALNTRCCAHGEPLWSSVIVRRAWSDNIRCLHSRGHICDPILTKLSQNVCFEISRLSINMGHIGSKTRSPCQILGKSCLHSKGYICDPILMTLDQNVCLYNI